MSNINRAVTRTRRALGRRAKAGQVSMGRAPGRPPAPAIYSKDLRVVREAWLRGEEQRGNSKSKDS